MQNWISLYNNSHISIVSINMIKFGIQIKYNNIRAIFFISWHILWQNTFYLYLNSSKWILKYHEICFTNKTSGIIEDMKIAPRNKCEKLKRVNLNTSLIQVSIKDLMNLDTSSILLDLSSFKVPEFQKNFLAHDDLEF